MFSVDRWSEILEAISKNKLRTFLTGVSVAVGILILVLLLGIGEGMANGTKKQFERNAENRIEVSSGITAVEHKGLNPGRRITLKNKDYEFIDKKFDDKFEYSSSVLRNWSASMTFKNNTGNYKMEGVMPDYQFIQNAGIINGRFINALDYENSKKYVVIGKKVRDELFKDVNPVGKTLKATGVNFKVVGVFQDPGGDREESLIFMPLSTMQKIYGGTKNIRKMSLTLPSTESYDEALKESKFIGQQIEDILKSTYKVAPQDLSAIKVNSTIEEAKQFYDLTSNIKLFFWVVGLASLFSGIIGVSNIMLIIVKERTKEIGIRKALGAKPTDIVGMIMHESIFVTAVSGFLGLLIGLLLLESVGPLIDSPFISNPEVNLKVAISTVFVLVFAGALAGFYPAWKGAKIKPIVALRDE